MATRRDDSLIPHILSQKLGLEISWIWVSFLAIEDDRGTLIIVTLIP